MNKKTKPHPLVSTVSCTLKKRRMLAPGDRVLVGLSGGADSVALLHVLLQLAPVMRLEIGVAHLNHRLRGQASDKDARFVESISRKHHLPCHVLRKDIKKLQKQTGGSIEETGRQARYRFFEQTAEKFGFDKIATAHHADDSAEVVVMNLVRGSGPRGISGIPPSRGSRIIRPLIDVRQRDILSFVHSNKLAYVVDESNRNTDFVRNRVRHEIIPQLSAALNPGFSDALVRFAAITRSEEQWLDEIVARMLDSATLAKGPGSIRLSAVYLSGLHTAAARRVVRAAIEYAKGDLNRIGFRHVDSVVSLILKGPDPGECHLPCRILVVRHDGCVAITREKEPLKSATGSRFTPTNTAYRYEVDHPGTAGLDLLIQETGQRIIFSIIKNRNVADLTKTGHPRAFFDMEKLEFPLTLRNFQAGDRFVPLGMRGSQKVKKLFINKKVAKKHRESCPILLSCGQIIWIVGHRADDRYKIDPATRYVLKAELLLA